MSLAILKQTAKYPKQIYHYPFTFTLKNQRCFSADSTNPKIQGQYDYVVVGGGIIGVATACELSTRFPTLKMTILEKENHLAAHQSSHNSGVIHAGIYYKPGSLKSKLCTEGLRLAYQYFEERQIPHKKVGKLIVATDPHQLKPLQDLYERGRINSVPGLELIKSEDIPSIEPNCRGLKALWSPLTGIVDYSKVTDELARDFQQNGGRIHLNFQVSKFLESESPDYPVRILAKNGKTILAKFVLTCGGLYSDHLAEMSGCPRAPRIIPFRGEYLLLKPEKSDLIKGNIYPVPDARFPFLGVHFTPKIDGSVWLGPNAILAFKREGYKWSDFNLQEFSDSLMYPGFRKLARKYFVFGTKEMLASIYLTRQVKQLQKFVPSLKRSDVVRGPAGVRAQALDTEGNLVDDFYFDTANTEKGSLGNRILHCRNTPSPGATSSLAIAKMIADTITTLFNSNR